MTAIKTTAASPNGSYRMRWIIALISVCFTICASIAGGAWYLITERFDNRIAYEASTNRTLHGMSDERIGRVEQRMDRFEESQKRNTEMLIRIDENVKRLLSTPKKEIPR